MKADRAGTKEHKAKEKEERNRAIHVVGVRTVQEKDSEDTDLWPMAVTMERIKTKPRTSLQIQ